MRLFLLLFLCLSVGCASAQSPNKKALKYYQKAQEAMANRDYPSATDLFEKSISADPQYLDAYLSLANLYQLDRKPEQSIALYRRAVKMGTPEKKLGYAYLAVGNEELKEGNYEQAYEYLLLAQTHYEGRLHIKQQIEGLLQNCEFAREAKKNPIPFEPVLLAPPLNQWAVQSHPVQTADGLELFFTIRLPDGNEDLRRSVRSEEGGAWGEPQTLGERLTTPKNEGTASIAADGRTLVLTSCDREDGAGSCDLYISYRIGDTTWSQPMNLGGGINTRSWDSEPSLSSDGNTLVFSSYRGGGYGEEDLYIVRRNQKGDWGSPQNLGPLINTAGREVAPFLHASGRRLYFSTTGRPGMGELDLFVSELVDSAWTLPVNLGYPVNSAQNDVSLFLAADYSEGYMTKYKKVGTEYESFLYRFEMPKSWIPAQHTVTAIGTVTDAKTGKPVEARVQLSDLDADSTLQFVKSDPETGRYLVVLTEGKRYGLFAEAKGYLLFSHLFDVREVTDLGAEELDIQLIPLEVGAKVLLENLFFASGSAEIEAASYPALTQVVRLLELHPRLRLEIAGHTDDVGADAANLKLSQARAQAVVDYLVGKGMYRRRFLPKGYGEKEPQVPNTSEENRAQNRRIELRVF